MNGFAQPPRIVRWTLELEETTALDRPVHALEPKVHSLFGAGKRGWVLRGEWLGHALHPSLTDVVLGTWTSASLLDLFGGPESVAAAQKLIATGLFAVGPTAWSGWAEWSTAGQREKRGGSPTWCSTASRSASIRLPGSPAAEIATPPASASLSRAEPSQQWPATWADTSSRRASWQPATPPTRNPFEAQRRNSGIAVRIGQAGKHAVVWRRVEVVSASQQDDGQARMRSRASPGIPRPATNTVENRIRGCWRLPSTARPRWSHGQAPLRGPGGTHARGVRRPAQRPRTRGRRGRRPGPGQPHDR